MKTPVLPKTPVKRAPAKPSVKAPKHAAKPAPKASYHHGNLRETLLIAADAVLTERGAQGITLRDVAKAAGVSHAAPYHHFASLNDLLATVAERAFITLGDAVEAAAQADDPRERLLQISEAYVACARAHPAQFRLMFGPLLAHKSEYPAFKAAAERAFGTMLATACAYDPQNGPEYALAGWSLVHGMSNLMIDGAFDGLPMQVGNRDGLARVLVGRVLGRF